MDVHRFRHTGVRLFRCSVCPRAAFDYRSLALRQGWFEDGKEFMAKLNLGLRSNKQQKKVNLTDIKQLCGPFNIYNDL
jgi:hypothetical protein